MLILNAKSKIKKELDTILTLTLLTLSMFSCEYASLPNKECNLKDISYSKQVQPIITAKCATASCHSPKNASLVMTLSNYQEVFRDSTDVKRYILNKLMPIGSPLSECEINTIVKWIDQGGKDN